MSTKRKPQRRHPLVIPGAILVTATLAVALSVGATGAGIRSAQMSDAEMQRIVDATHDQNVKFLNDFQAKHGDPRTLTVIRVSTWQGPPLSLGSAAAEAAIILDGKVQSVQFVADPSGNLPEMIAAVQVRQLGKGSVSGSTVVVRQLGGPVAQPGGRGGLVELDGEQLMLPGDEVLLLLNRLGPTSSEYRAVYGAGVQFVRNGKMAGDAATRYGLDSQDFASVWSTLTNPRLPVGALPLRLTSN